MNERSQEVGDLKAITDRARIVELLIGFESGSRDDLDDLVSIFAEDAILNYSGRSISGIEEIRDYFSGYAHANPASRTAATTFDNGGWRIPFLGNVNISFDGDVAHCESSTLATHAGLRDGKAIVVVRAVQDIDDLRWTEAGWKVFRRVHSRLWGFEVAGALGTDVPPPQS